MINNTGTLLYKKIISFGEMSDTDLERFFEIAGKRTLLKGETFLNSGQLCNCIVFVEKGYLRTFIDKDGVEINTNFTFEGSFTTNLKSLLSASPSDSTIEAAESATVFDFDKDKLLGLYKISSGIESFGRKLLEGLLAEQEEHSNLFKLYAPAERYHYLETNKPEWLQRISLSQLASYLGVARETLSRIRKK